MRKFFALALILLAMPVFAVHNSSIIIDPLWSSANKQTDYSVLINNIRGDAINEVRVRTPSAFSGLKCGSAPDNWVLAYSDSAECLYKTSSDYINSATTKGFAASVKNAGDGSFVWEIRTKDVLDGIAVHNPLTKIDATPPSIKGSTLVSPNGGNKWTVGNLEAIEWNSDDIEDANLKENPVTIEYSTDSKNWMLIAVNETNDGNYEWKVPGINSTTVKVRITASDAVGNKASDESDSVFSIKAGPPKFSVKLGETRSIDIDGDKANDITVTIDSISDDSATLIFTKLAQKPEARVQTITQIPGWVMAVMVVLVIIVLYLLWRVIKLERKHKK